MKIETKLRVGRHVEVGYFRANLPIVALAFQHIWTSTYMLAMSPVTSHRVIFLSSILRCPLLLFAPLKNVIEFFMLTEFNTSSMHDLIYTQTWAKACVGALVPDLSGYKTRSLIYLE